MIHKTIKWSVFAFLSVLLAFALAFGWMQTEPGRRQVAGVFGKMLSSGAETQVEFRGLSGFFPLHFHVAEMEIRDSSGSWLIVRDIAARWLPHDLLHGYIRFQSLRAESLELARLPKAVEPSAENSAWPPAWLGILTTFRVEDLHLKRVVVSESLYGKPAVLTVDGWLKSHPDLQEASLTVEGGTTTLRAYGALQDSVLTLDALFEEPEGGLVARAAGIGGPLSLDLKGKGALKKWKGRLRAVAGGMGRMEADIALEDSKLKAQGKIHLDPKGMLLPLVSLAGMEPEFFLEARRSRSDALELDHFSFHGEETALTMAGSMDLAGGKAGGRFSLQCGNLEPLGTFLNVEVRGRLSAEGSLSGMITQPEISSRFRIDEGGIQTVDFSIMEGDLVAAFSGNPGPQQPGFRVSGQGRVKELETRGFREKELKWEVVFERPSEKVITIKALGIQGARMAVKASGVWKPREEALSSFLRLTLKPPASLAAFAPLVGNQVNCSAKIALDKGKRLTFSEIHAEAAAASVDGSGTLDLGLESLDFKWLLTLPQLSVLTPSLGYPVNGSLRVQGLSQGPLKALSTTLDAGVKDFQVKGHPVEAGKLSLLVHGLPPKMSGRLTLLVQYNGLAWQTKADVAVQDLGLSFPSFSVEGPGTHLDGDLDARLDGSRVRGKINGLSRDLSLFSPWTGQKIEGSADVAVRFQKVSGSEELELELSGKQVSTRFGQARKLHLLSRISGLTTDPRGTLELKLEQANSDELKLEKSMIRLEGGRNQVRFSATGEGRFRQAFEAETAGLFSIAEERLRCDRFHGSYGGVPVRFLTPLAIRRTEEGLDLSPFTLKAGAGLLRGQGFYHKDSLNLGLQFENVLLQKLPFPSLHAIAGTASGKMRLDGALESPEGTAEVRVTGIEYDDPRLSRLPSGTVVLSMTLQERRLRSHFSVEGITLSPLKANLELPVNLSFSPFVLSLSAREEVQGDLEGEINLDRIPSLFSLVDQNLKGRMRVGIKLEGSLEDPMITGHIGVEKGTYENLRTGTLLTDLTMEISAEPPRLVIEHARATDGETGTLVAEGWLDLRPSQGSPFSVEVALDRAKLLRTDNAVAAASGKLILTGSHGQALLSGKIVIDPAEFRLPKRLPPSMTEVQVVEINKPDGHAPPPAKSAEGGMPPIKLDVSASSPGRVHVEGRGLVSEWQGHVDVRGSAAKPVITGNLSIVRGQIDFLGKRFDLVKGTLLFNGSSPPSPALDATAEAKTQDITVHVNLLGPVVSPQIRLTSEPPLPSDEILSRLLFGRGAKSISPIQAVQLANAINTLAGGGGTDVLGRIRRLIGVETLTLNQSGEDYTQSTVSVGKYLSEDVYVEVEKGLSPETGKASLKWDVTPNVTVGTEAGVNAQTGVSVDWRWDY